MTTTNTIETHNPAILSSTQTDTHTNTQLKQQNRVLS